MATEIGQEVVVATDAPTKEYELATPRADKWKPQPKVKAGAIAGGVVFTTVSSVVILLQKLYPNLTFTVEEMGALVFLVGGLFWAIQTAASYLKSNN